VPLEGYVISEINLHLITPNRIEINDQYIYGNAEYSSIILLFCSWRLSLMLECKPKFTCTFTPLYLSIPTLAPIFFDLFLYYAIWPYIIVLTRTVGQIPYRQTYQLSSSVHSSRFAVPKAVLPCSKERTAASLLIHYIVVQQTVL
jgi:hypothetical protein